MSAHNPTTSIGMIENTVKNVSAAASSASRCTTMPRTTRIAMRNARTASARGPRSGARSRAHTERAAADTARWTGATPGTRLSQAFKAASKLRPDIDAVTASGGNQGMPS